MRRERERVEPAVFAFRPLSLSLSGGVAVVSAAAAGAGEKRGECAGAETEHTDENIQTMLCSGSPAHTDSSSE